MIFKAVFFGGGVLCDQDLPVGWFEKICWQVLGQNSFTSRLLGPLLLWERVDSRLGVIVCVVPPPNSFQDYYRSW